MNPDCLQQGHLDPDIHLNSGPLGAQLALFVRPALVARSFFLSNSLSKNGRRGRFVQPDRHSAGDLSLMPTWSSFGFKSELCSPSLLC